MIPQKSSKFEEYTGDPTYLHETDIISEKTTKEFNYDRNTKTKITNPPKTELISSPKPPTMDFGETQFIEEESSGSDRRKSPKEFIATKQNRENPTIKPVPFAPTPVGHSLRNNNPISNKPPAKPIRRSAVTPSSNPYEASQQRIVAQLEKQAQQHLKAQRQIQQKILEQKVIKYPRPSSERNKTNTTAARLQCT